MTTTSPPLSITPKTTVHTLLKEYPALVDFFAGYHPEFGVLANPVLRQTMARMATLQRVAGMGNIPLNQLMIDVAAEIGRLTGVRPAVENNALAGGIDPERLAALKQIIEDLHAGQSPDALSARFAELIADVEAGEIALMEQELIGGGLPVAEVKRLCDVHVRVFSPALDTHDRVEAPAGHPVNTFQRENDAILAAVERLRTAIATARAGHWPSERGAVAAALADLEPIELHYLRKEIQLFPFLERRGIVGPTQVMWGVHDDIRAALKEAAAFATAAGADAALDSADGVAQAVADMVTKEEQVLFPMALDSLTDAEWVEVRAGEGQVGYAYVDCVPDWPAGGGQAFVSVDTLRRTPPAPVTPGAAAAPAASNLAGRIGSPRIDLDTGALTAAQINLMINTLRLDISFVDENDEVRFYSEGERIFPRGPGVIGRKVQNCHPPDSYDKVQQILDAFREGSKDVADFWINMGGRFLHIRYFAMRDADGAYRGTLETVQDVTGIRALEGERRLVDW